MVFQSLALMVRARGPDEFWRKRKIFQLSAHYIGRRRNCYSVAIKIVHRALAYATKGRKLKKLDMQELWDARISAGCEQFGIALPTFQESLLRENIQINRKALSDLAIWEPKTFESIVRIARERAVADQLVGVSGRHTTDNAVITTTAAAAGKSSNSSN